MQAEENLNRTYNLLDDVEDRIRRLNDGINSSRYAMSDADLAISTIKRLRNWLVQPLKVKKHSLLHDTSETINNRGTKF